MRLIDCQTLEFEEYYDEDLPKYAILSHRWQDDEVSYRDMLSDRGQLEGRQGYQKIKSFCDKAREQQMTHVWVDTCCIDKSSSAELSEAINSMYAWYSRSIVCHAYLYDYLRTNDELGKTPDRTSPAEIGSSEYFSRGWTLQELIAPPRVLFYDRNWNFISTKFDLARELSESTGIPENVLQGNVDLSTLTVAEKMSWASERRCTRVEDTAYSLLGLFDINMPMLYGEGPKAFIRLQQEIIKQTNDHTIFLWWHQGGLEWSMLASRPVLFDRRYRYRRTRDARGAYTITNNGLAINLLMHPWVLDVYMGLLDCEICLNAKTDTWYRPGIFLLQNHESGTFRRILPHQRYHFLPVEEVGNLNRQRMNIDIDMHNAVREPSEYPDYGFEIGYLHLATGTGVVSLDNEFSGLPKVQWDAKTRIFALKARQNGTAGVLQFPFGPDRLIQAVKLGFDAAFDPVCVILTNKNGPVDQPAGGWFQGDPGRDLSDKNIFLVDCLERYGWDTSVTSSQDQPQRDTFYLKPPEDFETLDRKWPWGLRVRSATHKMHDFNGHAWQTQVLFYRVMSEDVLGSHTISNDAKLWTFLLTCTKCE